MLNVFHFCRHFLFFFSLSSTHYTENALTCRLCCFSLFLFSIVPNTLLFELFCLFFFSCHMVGCRLHNNVAHPTQTTTKMKIVTQKKKTRWKKTKKKKSETQDGGTGVMGRWKRLKITWSTFFVEQINTDREWRIAIMMIIIMKLKSRVSSFEGTNGTRRLF